MLQKLDPTIESKTIMRFNKPKYLQRVHKITYNANNEQNNYRNRQLKCQTVAAANQIVYSNCQTVHSQNV